jgi:hypothetical protein
VAVRSRGLIPRLYSALRGRCRAARRVPRYSATARRARCHRHRNQHSPRPQGRRAQSIRVWFSCDGPLRTTEQVPCRRKQPAVTGADFTPGRYFSPRSSTLPTKPPGRGCGALLSGRWRRLRLRLTAVRIASLFSNLRFLGICFSPASRTGGRGVARLTELASACRPADRQICLA